MPSRTADNSVRIEIRYMALGQQIENVLYATGGATPDASNMLELGSAVADSIETNFPGVMPQELQFMGVQVTSIDPATAISVFVPPSATIVGIDANGILPLNVTFAVHKTTNVGGRHGQGRAYHPAMASDWVVGDTVQTTPRNNIVAAWNQLKDDVENVPTLAAWFLSIASVATGAAPTDPYNMIQITGFTTRDNIVDSQRRRLTGRGR